MPAVWPLETRKGPIYNAGLSIFDESRSRPPGTVTKRLKRVTFMKEGGLGNTHSLASSVRVRPESMLKSYKKKSFIE